MSSSININLPAPNTPMSSVVIRAQFQRAASDINALQTQIGGITGLSTSGIIVQNGSGSYSSITITGTANQITVVSGSGSAGNPVISIATNPTLPGTGCVVVPTGSTAQRVNSTGGFRFNSDMGLLEYYDGTAWHSVGSPTAGTVVSVGLQGDGLLFTTAVTNSPITNSGTMVLVLAQQAAGLVLAGPISGANAAPTFRALRYSDIPNPTYRGVTGTTTTDPATLADSTIGWRSTAAGAKTQNIPSPVGCAGKILTIVDAAGTASAANPINLVPTVGTISNAAAGISITVPTNSFTIQSDGVSDWVII